MAVRLVCPSCSATLSVKDEYAGRAVKCPKCGGVIPASPPDAAAPPAAPPPPSTPAAALPPPAPPEPERPLFEELDGPAKAGGGSKIKGRPTGSKPGAKADAGDDEDAPPRRRDRDDDRDGPGGRQRGRDRDEGEDDRPARGRRKGRDADDDRDSDGAGGKKKGGSNVAVILLVVFGGLFTCCGGGAFAVYYYVIKPVKEGVEKGFEEFKQTNPSVNVTNFNSLKFGTTTRAQADTMLGGRGRAATADDLLKVFPSNTQNKQLAAWTEKLAAGRVVIWQSRDDYTILVLFHPNADGRVQAKEWRTKSRDEAGSGGLDDAEFERMYPADGGPIKPLTKTGGALRPGTVVPAEELAREFKADPTAAAGKYVTQTFSVSGKLSDIDVVAGETNVILDGGPGDGGVRISCALKKVQFTFPFSFARGQRLVVEGRCVGTTAGSVSFNNCSITSSEKDPATPVEAAALITAYRTEATGDAMFKGKTVQVKNAVIESFASDGVMIATQFGKKAGAKKIRVEYDPKYRDLTFTPPLRVGGGVTIRGVCEGVTGDEIVITDAWFTH